jgi:hypothetical protein
MESVMSGKKTPNRIKNSITALALASCLASALAALAAPAPTPAPRGDLSQWEQQLLGQSHERDPLDKRIQRLELLLFNGTQEGSLSERLDQIRARIESRSAVRPSKGAVNGSLEQLEQKILKKTFATEPVETRLTRLETKLFGKASPSMSAADRVDRLKRTIGLGEPPPIAQFPNNNLMEVPFQHGYPNGMIMPFDQSMRPDELNRQMSDMFRQFNQQLRQLHRLPNGSDSAPFTQPEMPQMPQVPQMPRIRKHSGNELPPYLDPNSI